MSIDSTTLKAIRSTLNVVYREDLGVIEAQLIRRYATAVGDENPLYQDAAAARGHGYPDIIAPPNLVASIVCWGPGAPERTLRSDGTEQGTHIPGLPSDGVRVMGGGERLVFHAPIVAGAHVILEGELTAVVEKETSNGPMGVLTYANRYLDSDGNALVTATRTMLLR